MHKALVICAVILMLLAGMTSACNGGGTADGNKAVYVMTNAAAGNSILIYDVDDAGTLAAAGSISTQGNGSGSSINPLNSQGSLSLTSDKAWLVALNAGSNEISVFSVTKDGLTFISKTSSLGQFPISVAVSGKMVFVLNQKSTPPNITGFTLDKTGTLTAIPDAVRLLPPGTYSQIGFSPNGKWLVVAGESSNLLLTYSMDGSEPSSDPFTFESNGAGPAAFAFDNSGNLLVAEAGSSAVSSYSISNTGLKSITASLSTGQKTPHWIIVSGNHAYTVNMGSDAISALAISTAVSGQLTLTSSTAAATSGPTELAVSSNGKYIYVLNPEDRSISVFQVETDGSLKSAGSTSGLFGISVQGIAAS